MIKIIRRDALKKGFSGVGLSTFGIPAFAANKN